MRITVGIMTNELFTNHSILIFNSHMCEMGYWDSSIVVTYVAKKINIGNNVCSPFFFLHSFPPMSSEVLRMNDGGHVCLDWYNEMEGEQVDRDRPTVLMLPGMTGLHTAKLQLHRHTCVEILMLCVYTMSCY